MQFQILFVNFFKLCTRGEGFLQQTSNVGEMVSGMRTIMLNLSLLARSKDKQNNDIDLSIDLMIS